MILNYACCISLNEYFRIIHRYLKILISKLSTVSTLAHHRYDERYKNALIKQYFR